MFRINEKPDYSRAPVIERIEEEHGKLHHIGAYEDDTHFNFLSELNCFVSISLRTLCSMEYRCNVTYSNKLGDYVDRDLWPVADALKRRGYSIDFWELQELRDLEKQLRDLETYKQFWLEQNRDSNEPRKPRKSKKSKT